MTGFEAAAGGLGDDRLRGDAGRNGLFGGDGNDRLFGADGRDWLSGGSGLDRLEGGSGDDYLFGDGGPDRLDGGDGADTLRSAADFFVDRVVCGRKDHGAADRRDRVRGNCPALKPRAGQLRRSSSPAHRSGHRAIAVRAPPPNHLPADNAPLPRHEA